MPQRDLHGFVAPLCEKLAAEMGYELVDAELVKEGPGGICASIWTRRAALRWTIASAFTGRYSPGWNRWIMISWRSARRVWTGR